MNIGTPKTLFMIMMQPGEWFEVFVGQGKGFCIGFFFPATSELSHLKKKRIVF
jgi:hypothetical protein